VNRTWLIKILCHCPKPSVSSSIQTLMWQVAWMYQMWSKLFTSNHAFGKWHRESFTSFIVLSFVLWNLAHSLDDTREKRNFLIGQLFHTENNYLSKLQLLVEHFLSPLETSLKTDSFISESGVYFF
jgi:hypothetical protein